MCRCFGTDPRSAAWHHMILPFSGSGGVWRSYQRDLAVMAINNRNIKELYLDNILLDYTDYQTMLTELSNSLEVFCVKILRVYEFCNGEHAFLPHGLPSFLHFISQTCKKLKVLSIYNSKTGRVKTPIDKQKSNTQKKQKPHSTRKRDRLVC